MPNFFVFLPLAHIHTPLGLQYSTIGKNKKSEAFPSLSCLIKSCMEIFWGGGWIR